MKNNNYPAS